MTARLIIFDCDGTLVDSQHLIVAAMESAFGAEGLPAPPREAVLSIIGLSLPEAFSRLAGARDAETVVRLSGHYSAAFGKLRQDPDHQEPLYEGAREALAALAAEEGTLLGIATGKSRRGVDRLLDRLEMGPIFATIQTADVAPSKPHPGMIERAMAETGAGRDATAMIGDTSFDMEMARAAGVTPLGVGWGYHPVEELRAAGAHRVARDFPDLERTLAAISGRKAAE